MTGEISSYGIVTIGFGVRVSARAEPERENKTDNISRRRTVLRMEGHSFRKIGNPFYYTTISGCLQRLFVKSMKKLLQSGVAAGA